MKTTRRTFGLGLAAAFFAGGCMGLMNGVRDLRTKAKVGVLANPEIEWPASAGPFRRALRHFARERVDAVILLGDLTRAGYPDQYAVLARTWMDAFKGVCAPRCLIVPGPGDTEDGLKTLRGIGETTTTAGGAITVGGCAFGASYRKRYGAWKGAARQPSVSFFSGMKPALTDEICFLNPSARAICAGSMRGVFVPSVFEPVPAASAAAQGLLATVVGDEIAIVRLDFTQKPAGRDAPLAEEVAPPWRVPLDPAVPVADPSASARPPRFAPGSAVTVVSGYAAPAKGAFATERVFTVRWPAAQTRFGGGRAKHYELTATAGAEADGRVLFTRLLLSPAFHLAEARDLQPVSTVVPVASLGAVDRVRFGTTPVSSAGKRGETLWSAPCPVR